MYSEDERKDIQRRVCTLIAGGRSLKNILENEPGMPSRDTIYGWLYDDSVFSDNYTRAREAQADYYADEITDIADTETDPQKARNRIDARKWAAGKLKPKTYGDRIQHAGDKESPISFSIISGVPRSYEQLDEPAEAVNGASRNH